MLSIFTKPLEQITADDLTELTSKKWSENFQVEYKKTLPDKNAERSSWLSGGDKITDAARDKLFSEIIAFANSMGGTLILGIEETLDKPPRAEGINPIPRVGDLASRLEDMAKSVIDPILPNLQIWPIEVNHDDKSGVIIFRVLPSRRAPHRLKTTGRCYIRNGTSSQEMDMRQIQDMTLNVARDLAGIDKVFQSRQEAFHKWGTIRKRMAAVRVTAIPLLEVPDLGRLYGNRKLFHFDPSCTVTLRGQQHAICLQQTDFSERPVLRGICRNGDSLISPYRYEMYQNGAIDLWAGNSPYDNPAYTPPQSQNDLYIYHSTVLSCVAGVIKAVHHLRTEIGMPDAEYGLEVEIMAFSDTAVKQPITYEYLEGQTIPPYIKKPVFSDLPFVLPRMQVAGVKDSPQIIDLVDKDIYDALGVKDEWKSLCAQNL